MDDLSKGLELSVVGIIRPKDNVNYGSLSSGFYYTKELTEYILDNSVGSEVVRYLKNNNLKAYNTSNSGPNIVYYFTYLFDDTKDGVKNGVRYNSLQTFVPGKSSMLSSLMAANFMGGMASSSALTIRDLGGDRVPNEIAIYPVDFEVKEKVLQYLKDWNELDVITVNGRELTKENRSEITYTDTLSLVIEMINTMIKVITVALIIFTAISLVVSTVMIGIITYVSVVERTKEIGVIRSLGGRKKDVGHLFNAETFIIGLFAGLLGIGITYILQIIGNVIIGHFADINRLIHLTLLEAVIMVVVSVGLTLISGLIPSKAAARMDPVNALRTE